MTGLRDTLNERNETLFKEVEGLVDKATPQLWHSYAAFPSGTSHTPQHTRTVESIAGWILSEQFLAALSDDEIGFLILACHYHDLGMVGSEADNASAEGRDLVRREHAVSIGDWIRRDWRTLGFPDENYADILALVCKGHRPKRRDGTAHWDDLPRDRIISGGRSIRVRLIASLIYAADELHIGADRATEREEEFNQITSPESLRHWKRHQATHGPAIIGTDLCFDGRVSTPWFEIELVKSLKKAFQAVAESQAEIDRAGIAHGLRGIRFTWYRKDAWKLLAASVMADLRPRSVDEIAKAVSELYVEATKDRESLSALCVETNDAESIDSALQEVIDREFFIITEDHNYVLSERPAAATYFLDLGKKADEIDVLFLSPDSPQYESQLYDSEFGRRHLKNHLHPKLQRDFHVDVVQAPAVKHVKTVLERSATASRIIDMISLPPSVLVQYAVLDAVSVAGVCADLIKDPEQILDASYRSAVRHLIDSQVTQLPRFLRFIEELAIIKGLTIEQVSEAVVSSGAELEQLGDEVEKSLKLTQSFPVSRPDWSIGHLMLAGKRAGVPVTIQSRLQAPLTLSEIAISDDVEDTLKPENLQLVAMTIAPGQAALAKTFSLRASMRFDPGSQEFILAAQQLSECDTGLPLILQVTVNQPGTANCSLQLPDPEICVGDVLALSDAAHIAQQDSVCTVIMLDDNEFIRTHDLDLYELGEGLTDELIERLAAIDETIPVPIHLPERHEQRLTQCESAQFKDELDAVSQELREEPLTVTTAYLRFANASGKDYYEEYLGDLPLGRVFKPKVSGDRDVEERFEHDWELGQIDVTFGLSFREDIYELANSLRDWANDRSLPLPFEDRREQGIAFHYCRTHMSLTFSPFIDRRWYRERRLTIRLAPASDAERFALQSEYWSEKGDEQRAQLLNELHQLALAEHPIQQGSNEAG